MVQTFQALPRLTASGNIAPSASLRGSTAPDVTRR